MSDAGHSSWRDNAERAPWRKWGVYSVAGGVASFATSRIIGTDPDSALGIGLGWTASAMVVQAWLGLRHGVEQPGDRRPDDEWKPPVFGNG